MAGSNNYEKIKAQNNSPEEQYAKTIARIKQIQTQLGSAVRSGKLKDKVCVITGAGSLKGIG